MSFSNWPLLVLLFIPLGMLVGVWLRQGRRIVFPFDHGRQSRGHGWQFLINVMQSMPALILAVAILLLAGPRELRVPRDRRVLTNIEFCLDVSGSMITPFGEGSRYDAAINAMNQFVDHRPGDAFGLTLCSSISVPWIPLTKDASAFQCAAPFVRPENMFASLGGGTMLGVGLRECQEQLLRHEDGDRTIVLVSDGASFDLTNGEEETIGRELRDNGIVLYYVHIGGGQPPPSTAATATITGGATFAAGDEAGLKRVFQRIDEMQPTRIERTYADVLDMFRPFCVAGLSLVGMALFASFGLRYTPW